MRAVSAVLVLALAAGAAFAADGIKPGKWEFAAQVQVPNMPKLPPGVHPSVEVGPPPKSAAWHSVATAEDRDPTPAAREAVLRTHIKITEAIEEGDSARARHLAARHRARHHRPRRHLTWRRRNRSGPRSRRQGIRPVRPASPPP